ncbi:hypothetical protein KDN34_00250 [Shewanella yunxiaonensis]|uniref:Uncharacterized protein n=1 Tax=Shewanella yunxiaonensis TaxID=2829809 RepID=A0ABX7YT65_9GAMM|nr:hypothetical protein [Shewanella yunxiaonensis]QUN05964.1 hypothetical protein KDN34_00250 [Shewanella yunxiaonensis]
MRNLLLTITVLMMLFSQALSPRQAVAMPVAQHTFAQMLVEPQTMKHCCQGQMHGRQCSAVTANCSPAGTCVTHCANLISAPLPIGLATLDDTATQAISHNSWSVQTVINGLKTPPPDSL